MISARSFWTFQLVLLAALAGVVVAEWQRAEFLRQPPIPRTTPLAVRADYDYPEVIADDQLRDVLLALQPRLRGQRPRINHVDHALRFWGAAATFSDDSCLSGAEMREILTRHTAFASVWGPETESLLQTTEAGVAVRTRLGEETASHVDHTLAGLAEVGTPVEFPLMTPDGPRTLQDMLIGSLRSFELNQVEYEWSAMAYLSYFPHASHWTAADGQEVTFDRLARRMMREPLPRGVCFGNHRLYTLAAMVQTDEEHHFLSTAVREQIERFLRDMTARLVRHQHEDGYWNGHWADEESSTPSSDDDTLASRIMVTGHTLEWWAIAPRSLHPPRETMVRAAQWLQRIIREMDEEEIREYYTYLTHAGRALTLWRGTTPETLAASGWVDVPSAPSLTDAKLSAHLAPQPTKAN